MQLSDKAIEEFKRLYREELGTVLDDSAAREEALRLLSLAQVLTEPIDSDRDAAFIQSLRSTKKSKRVIL